MVFDRRWWLVIRQWVWISMVGCGSMGVEIFLIFLGVWCNNVVLVMVAGDLWVVVVWWWW